MTLIEVLCGLVLLGTVLASVCVARGRFLRQWGAADRRLQAVRAVDAMLSQWIAGSPDSVPLPGYGHLQGAPNLIWRTRRIREVNAANLGVVIVRLEVFQQVAGSSLADFPDDAGNSRQPLLTVDFLLHDSRLAATPPRGNSLRGP